ncbi:MAG: hypothetical protein JRI45_02560 [Deltaproteobacteria bacterium]|nr:hypothetical protein [Deltaproteobacteria bacterium]MBW2068949.1 hypothetical protein [Deltaproteobacteria bacterium]
MFTEADIDREMNQLKIIWIAMLGSIGIYVFVAINFGGEIKAPLDPSLLKTIRLVLYALSILTVVITKLIRSKIIASISVGSERTGVPREMIGQVLQKYRVANIVSFALCETIAIYGLLLFLMGGSATDLYILIALSALSMFLLRPRREELEELIGDGWT